MKRNIKISVHVCACVYYNNVGYHKVLKNKTKDQKHHKMLTDQILH